MSALRHLFTRRTRTAHPDSARGEEHSTVDRDRLNEDAVIGELVAAAAQHAEEADQPVVFLVGSAGTHDYEMGMRFPSVTDDALMLSQTWRQDEQFDLPFSLCAVYALPHEYASRNALLRVLRRRPSDLVAALTSAGLRALGETETLALIGEHFADQAAAQRATVDAEMRGDVQRRVQTLLAGSPQVAHFTVETDSTLAVTAVGSDRLVQVAGSTPFLGRNSLRGYARRRSDVRATAEFFAGQPVSASALVDGSVRITVGKLEVLVPADSAPAVLSAVGNATTVAHQ